MKVCQPIILQNFCWKLHENESIVFGAPLGSATGATSSFNELADSKARNVRQWSSENPFHFHFLLNLDSEKRQSKKNKLARNHTNRAIECKTSVSCYSSTVDEVTTSAVGNVHVILHQVMKATWPVIF